MKVHKKIIDRNKFILVFFIDFILLGVSFITAVLVKRGRIYLTPDYGMLLGVYYLLWAIACALSKKNYVKKPKTYIEGLKPFLRCMLYLVVLLFFTLYLFQLFHYSRFILIFTLIVYLVLQTAFYTILYLLKLGPSVDVIEEKHKNNKERDYMAIDKVEREIKVPLKYKLRETLNENHEDIYNFIDSSLNLDSIRASESLMLDTRYSHNVLGVINSGHEFIGNLHRVNDIKRINRFFIAVNKRLIKGGYFYGHFETLEQRLKRRYSKYPKFFRKILYLFDFIWMRAFPKMPVLKKIYFSIHGTDSRVVSRIEILGRLSFCGFKIVKMQDIDNKLNFVVKKVSPPLKDENPSYGPVFKQKRIGLNGEIIYVYKFRTMHPYSEYSNNFFNKQNRFGHLAKVENDERITSWGKYLRKYWIDELPMLVNLLQGDLKLVGIRPISEALYNSRFPKEFREKKIRIKPGVIPVCYRDMPKSLEETWESERKYIERYREHPLRTDFVYFFKVFYNILFKGARSG